MDYIFFWNFVGGAREGKNNYKHLANYGIMKGEKAMTQITFEKFEDLTICNDFMFKKVMANKALCKRFVEAVMQKPIADIIYTETEKTLDTYYDSKGVRLDVIVADEEQTRYNLEMQVRNSIGKTGKTILPKRTRYYQSILDMDMLQKGQNYDELPPLALIFVCAFDFFGEGRYAYTIKSRCVENLELELENDVTILLLNALGSHGKISELVKNFLEYVNTSVCNDEFTRAVDHELTRIKRDKKVRSEYMVLEAKMRDATIEGWISGREVGKAEGIAEGKQQGEKCFAALMNKLYELGRNDDAQRVLNDEVYRAQLMKEFAIQ